jgi:hypothetical protein
VRPKLPPLRYGIRYDQRSFVIGDADPQIVDQWRQGEHEDQPGKAKAIPLMGYIDCSGLSVRLGVHGGCPLFKSEFSV